MGGLTEVTEGHVEYFFKFVVPVGEKKRDEQKGVEENVDGESPFDKPDGRDCLQNAFAFGFILLVFEFVVRL